MTDSTYNGTLPIYFYSTANDFCSARNFNFTARNNTINGDLCAYIDQAPTRGLWACPAGDEQCWTISKPCQTVAPNMPSLDQTLCTAGSADAWCCYTEWETCGNATRSGICLAKTFNNPLQYVQASLASLIAQIAVSALDTGPFSSVPTVTSVTPTSVDVTNADINLVAASATPVFTSVKSSSKPKSNTATTTAATGSSSASGTGSAALINSELGVPSSKLSHGAIAGIVISSVAVLTLIFIVAYLIYKRRKARKNGLSQELPSDSNVGLVVPDPPGTPMTRVPRISTNVPPVIREVSPMGPLGLSPLAVHGLSPAASHPGLSPAGSQQGLSPVESQGLSPVESQRGLSPAESFAPVSPVESHESLDAEPEAAAHSPAEPELRGSPLEGGTIISPMEPSPLQALMIHGRYPP